MTPGPPDAALKAGAARLTVGTVVAELDPTRCDDTVALEAMAEARERNEARRDIARMDKFNSAIAQIDARHPSRSWPGSGMAGTRHALALDRPAGPKRWRAAVARAYVFAAFVGYLRDLYLDDSKGIRTDIVEFVEALGAAGQAAISINARVHGLRAEKTDVAWDWFNTIETALQSLNDVVLSRVGEVRPQPAGIADIPDTGSERLLLMGSTPTRKPTKRVDWPGLVFAMRLAEIWTALTGALAPLRGRSTAPGGFGSLVKASFAVVDWPLPSPTALLEQVARGTFPNERYSDPEERIRHSEDYRRALASMVEWPKDAPPGEPPLTQRMLMAAILDAPFWTEGLVPDYPHSLDFDFAVACWRAEQPFSGFGPRAERL